MTFQEFKFVQAALETNLNNASKIMQEFPRLSNGLTPDSVKSTQAYKDAKAIANEAFQDLRRFKSEWLKVFSKELKAERKAKFAVK